MTHIIGLENSYSSGRTLVFEDGAGAAETISDGSYTDSGGSTLWYSANVANQLTIEFEYTSDGAETDAKFRLVERDSSDTAEEYNELATNNVISGVEEVEVHQVDFPHSASIDRVYKFACTPYKEYKIQFYQEDGTTTAALAYFTFVRV